MLKGSIVALVTPMTEGGALDTQALFNLLDWHIASGTDAIVVAGSTGEAATLNAQERTHLVREAIKHVAGRVPVIVGTGAQSTAQTLALTQEAKQLGADYALVVTPFYNRPPQRGLYAHFKAVAEVGLPVILYNVPSRTACDMLPDTVCELAAVPGIIGIKEASTLDRCKVLLTELPSDFQVFSGEDAEALAAVRLGAAGVISVAANVLPAAMHQLMQMDSQADALQAKLAPLFEALFWESNPIPVKWILGEMGRITPALRMPLTSLDPKYYSAMREVLKKTGVFNEI